MLEQEVVQLRSMIEREPSSAMLQLQLATVLHKLNHLSPDGGLRIPEAVNAYRSAVQNSPTPVGSCFVCIFAYELHPSVSAFIYSSIRVGVDCRACHVSFWLVHDFLA